MSTESVLSPACAEKDGESCSAFCVASSTDMFSTVFEPFRIKSVESIVVTNVAQRLANLKAASFNLFNIPSDQCMVDLLTDSGTGAMSANQWGAVMRGDESYAGSPSWFRFKAAIKNLFDFKHIIPAHQGRAAEHLLCKCKLKAGDVVLSNTLFDTTRANVESFGGLAIDLPCEQSRDTSLRYPFKGNFDLDALETNLKTHGDRVAFVVLTITNNSQGGHPVSMANIEAVSKLCKAAGRMLVFDSCRFAENAWFIHTRERDYKLTPVVDIVRQMFTHADAMTMSAKKDGLANIGGWLAFNDDALSAQVKEQLILTEGFPTYGGLSGRDLEAIAVGLEEVVQPEYLLYRTRSTAWLGDRLRERGVPIVEPCGGHAVFIDAKKLLPHIPPGEFPGQSLAVAMYLFGGVRACEIGSVMFGQAPDGSDRGNPFEYVRMAIPRRTYTESHMSYVADVCGFIKTLAPILRGCRITSPPSSMRHFTCAFAMLGDIDELASMRPASTAPKVSSDAWWHANREKSQRQAAGLPDSPSPRAGEPLEPVATP